MFSFELWICLLVLLSPSGTNVSCTHLQMLYGAPSLLIICMPPTFLTSLIPSLICLFFYLSSALSCLCHFICLYFSYLEVLPRQSLPFIPLLFLLFANSWLVIGPLADVVCSWKVSYLKFSWNNILSKSTSINEHNINLITNSQYPTLWSTHYYITLITCPSPLP